METPPKISHDPNHYSWVVFDFIVRNAFGLLTFLAGFVYQVYQMSGRRKRLTRAQCIMSVIMWFISGIAVVIALSNINMNKLIYGIVCWMTPIMFKPFADALAEHSPRIAEKVMIYIESMVDKKTKNDKI